MFESCLELIDEYSELERQLAADAFEQRLILIGNNTGSKFAEILYQLVHVINFSLIKLKRN